MLKDSTACGASLLLSAMACFAVSDALAKVLTKDLSPLLIAWFRYLILLAVTLPLVLVKPSTERSVRPMLQLCRAAALVVSAGLFLFALRLLAAAEATAMVFASPMFVTILTVCAPSLSCLRLERRILNHDVSTFHLATREQVRVTPILRQTSVSERRI